MNKVELLAPAGTKESFINAISAGANAIFMAGHRFGARAFAENFTEQDLIESIEYAHLRGVEVFIVVNTLTFDDEVSDLLAYTDTLVKHHIDALIVQDIGMIELLAKRYPDTAIHASTQVNAHHISQVKFLKSLGVKRVILARETDIETIKQIKQEVDIEIEVFIHGALCVSYSGNCLISSVLNDRSGNRGSCAYNCRLPYELLKDDEVIEEATHLLSAKDLMTIEYVDQLIEAGIDSFKIEGRMRKKEYVAQSVHAYRQAIDAYYEKRHIDLDEEIDKLKRVFNRDYTKGFMLNEVPKDINNDYRPNHMGVKIGEVIDYDKGYALIKLTESLQNGDGYRIIGEHDYGQVVTFMKDTKGHTVKEAHKKELVWLKVKERVYAGSSIHKTSDKNLEKSLQIYQDEMTQVVPLKGYVKAFIGKPLTFELLDEDHHKVFVSSDKPLEIASKKAVTKNQIIEHFSKFGGTPFYMSDIEVYTDDLCFIPISLMNELRREALEQLSSIRVYRDEPRILNAKLDQSFDFDDQEKLVVKVHTKAQLDAAIKSGIKEIYYDDIISVKDRTEDVTFIKAKKRIIEKRTKPIDAQTVVNEIGSIYLNKDNYPIITDEFVNVTNIHTAALLSNHNVSRITLSAELDKNHILAFSKRYHDTYKAYPNLEMVVYGHKDMMISKYCPVAKSFGFKPNCNLCFKNQYYLKHPYDGKFALINDGHCNMRIMDPYPYKLIDEIDQLRQANIKTFRLDFTLESYEETLTIIKAYLNKMNHKPYILPIGKSRKGHFM